MKLSHKIPLFLISVLGSILSIAQGSKEVEINLQDKWKTHSNQSYHPFTEDDNGHVSAVYFLLESGKYNGGRLAISSPWEFSVFVNGDLWSTFNKDSVYLKVDSLRNIAGESALTIGIYQQKIHKKSLTTEILLPQPASASLQTAGDFTKPGGYFRDFVVTGFLILLVILVIVIRSNVKLASDYFSVIRIFSLRESDDNQLYSRITSSSNILFYSYCSLIVSFYLMIIFHYVPALYKSAWPFQAVTFMGALGQWLKLSIIILSFFFIKIIIIFLFTRLFALNEIFGLHIFNWIRLMLIFFGTLSILLVVYHITRGQNEGVYTAFLKLVGWILLIWVAIVFPKVMRRTSYSLFHIFSYICATEIIPLLVSIKIIYY